MAPLKVQNKKIIFVKPPGDKYPEPGVHTKLVEEELDLDATPLDGGILVKTLDVSLDPYLRGRMRDGSKPSYFPAFTLNAPLQSHGLARVLKSEHSKYKQGALIICAQLYWAEYAVIKGDLLEKTTYPAPDVKIPDSNWLSGAGMPGQTAWLGLFEVGKPNKGETLFVTAASGAVGQIVGQLGKAHGMKVIGSAGSDEKVAMLKDFGYDVAWNYKTEDTEKFLKENGPIDVFFDNVGAENIDLFLEYANKNARMASCGGISSYNLPKDQVYGIKNWLQLFQKCIRIEGFLVGQWGREKMFQSSLELAKLIKDGKLKVVEDVTDGIENAEEAFAGIFHGKNVGKAIVRFAKE